MSEIVYVASEYTPREEEALILHETLSRRIRRAFEYLQRETVEHGKQAVHMLTRRAA